MHRTWRSSSFLVLHVLWSRHCDYPQFTDEEQWNEHSGNLPKMPGLRSDSSRIWAQALSLTDEAPSRKRSVIEQVSFLGSCLTRLYRSHQPVFKKQELLLFWEGAETLYLLCFGLMKPHPGGVSQFQSGYTLFALSQHSAENPGFLCGLIPVPQSDVSYRKVSFRSSFTLLWLSLTLTTP